MSEKRIIIIMHNDLMHYPPMISLIDILTELGEHVTYIGDYTESPTTRRFVSSGVNLIKLGYKRTGSQFNRLRAQFIYKKELEKILKDLAVNQLDLLWYVYSDSATFLHDLLSRYRYIVHYYEFDRLEYSWKFKLLYPSFDQSTLVQKAAGVVHCEYNRAQIFKGMTGLKQCPFILPNKPYIKEGLLDEPNMPQNIKLLIDEIKQKTEGKKVILYQGIFNSSERKLEEFCQAVNLLQDDYVLIAMGRGDNSYNQLQEKYASNRIIFIPFVIPPYHLLITQLASIGVLSYSPMSKTFYGVVNPIYCAPNKIFEYSKFNKPMISNDIPGLRNIFEKFNCGLVVEDPISAEKVKEQIMKIFENYDTFSEGANNYYNSIDIHDIVRNIVKSIG